jgi:hypothetical protein
MSGKSPAFSRASRARREGRFAIVTKRWRGMRWTRQCKRRMHVSWTAKSCGPDASTPASRLAVMIRRTTVAESPITGESTKDTVKTIRAGNAGCNRRTCGGLTRRAFYFLHARLRARRRARHSLRPLISRDEAFGSLGHVRAARSQARVGCLTIEINSRRPCESRDPYAVLVVLKGGVRRLSLNNRGRWLWVPAFAGTT